MLSPLSIDEYFVNELTVKGNPEYARGGKETAGELKIAFDIKQKNDATAYMISMRIEVNKSKRAFKCSPYHILIAIDGFLQFAEKTPQDVVKSMIGISGPALLYGVARGVVAQVTANYRHGKYLLPPVNFVELVKEMGKGKKDH